MDVKSRDELLGRLDERTDLWYNIGGGISCHESGVLSQIGR